jgi:hypothetical protein
MGFDFAKLVRCQVIAGLALAAAYAAEAQNAGRSPGQPILFSTPDDDGASSNTPSLSVKSPGLLNFANTIHSPGLNLSAAPPSEWPPPTAIVPPSQSQQMRQLLDERKNWALMTPEQILGVPTQKKVLGVPDRDTLAQPDNESVLMQFYDRLEQSRLRTNNADLNASETAMQPGLPGSRASLMTPNPWAPAGVNPASPSLISQFLNAATNAVSASAPTAAGGWSRSFNRPVPASQPASTRPDSLATFQQLLQLQPSSGDDAGAPAFGSPILRPIFPTPVSPAAAIAATPASAPLPVVSIGAFYTPLSSMAVAPTMAPLPGPFGQTNLAPVTSPTWKPQAPPWESSAPQLGAVPQRKF